MIHDPVGRICQSAGETQPIVSESCRETAVVVVRTIQTIVDRMITLWLQTPSQSNPRITCILSLTHTAQ